MNSDDIYILFFALVVPVLIFFGLSRTIRLKEKEISCFYIALKEYYPGSYVEQNKIIKRFRKALKMSTTIKIHWVVRVYHYLQILSIVCYFASQLAFLFFDAFTASLVSLIISVAPCVIALFWQTWFYLLQYIRGNRIKKTDPRFKKCDFDGLFK